jgi:hypothetical protein
MARNRTNYPSEGLFVSYADVGSHFADGVVNDDDPVEGGGFPIVYDGVDHYSRKNLPLDHPNGNLVEQLHRIQSVNYGLKIPRKAVHQYGQVGTLDSSLINEFATVDLDFSYYLSEGYNEKLLNFNIASHPNDILSDSPSFFVQNAFHNYISRTSGQNFFINTVPDGMDLYGSGALGASEHFTTGIGSGYLNNYSVEASVGEFPRASVSFSCLNIEGSVGNRNLQVPGLKKMGEQSGYKFSLPDFQSHPLVRKSEDILDYSPEQGVAAVRPSDIVLQLDSKNHSLVSKQNSNVINLTLGAAHIQSFQIEAQFERDPITKLGSSFADCYALMKPPQIVLRITAIVSELKRAAFLNSSGAFDPDVGYALCQDGAAAHIYLFDPCVSRGIVAEAGGFSVEDIRADVEQASMIFSFKDLKLESEQFSSAIGDNKMVDIILSTSGGSKNHNDSGLYIWGRSFDSNLLSFPEGFFLEVEEDSYLGAPGRGV